MSPFAPRICGPVPNSVIGIRILVRIVADFLQQRRQHQLRTGSEQKCVAVRRRARHLRSAGDAAGAAAILDDERLAEFCRQPFGCEPRHHVGVSAGDERHDDGHGPRRPVGRRMRFADHRAQSATRWPGPMVVDGGGEWRGALCACARKDCSCAKRSEQVMHWSCLNLSMTGFSPPFVCRCRPSCIFQATCRTRELVCT